MLRHCLSLGFVLFAVSCARSPIRSPEQAMRPLSAKLKFQDQLEPSSLLRGLNLNRERMGELLKSEGDQPMVFGEKVVLRSEYKLVLDHLSERLAANPSTDVGALIAELFEAHEVYGDQRWGDIFSTGYYEPIIRGSKQATRELSQAVYGVPKDMVVVRLDKYAETFPRWSVFQSVVTEQRSSGSVLRGRLVKSVESELPQVEPYYSRMEIDSLGLMQSPRPEILAYVDPVDAFFLQIQGSGFINFGKGGLLHVGYAAQNGHPYEAIGRYLFDVIPKDQMTQQKIERHLRQVSVEERDRILNLNPSYVFFRRLEKAALTSFGAAPVDGRTIATDRAFFPKGSLAFLDIELPQFSESQSDEPSSWSPQGRFVFDQDTGGAIRGPGRVDLYIGQGEVARQIAGVLKQRGRLYYFSPRREVIQSLMNGR